MRLGQPRWRVGVGLVGSRIRQARESIGISQAAVALSLVPPKQRSSVGRYESGHDEPSLDTVEQLAAVLNVSPCWLAFGVDHAK